MLPQSPPEWFSVRRHIHHPIPLNRHSGVILVRNPANLAAMIALLQVRNDGRTEYKPQSLATRVWVRFPPQVLVFP